MTVFYQGWNVDFLTQDQTLHPRGPLLLTGYMGDDFITYLEPAPRFPLSVRYESFCRRLAAARKN